MGFSVSALSFDYFRGLSTISVEVLVWIVTVLYRGSEKGDAEKTTRLSGRRAGGQAGGSAAFEAGKQTGGRAD